MLLTSIFMMSMIAVATQQANALEAPLVMIENYCVKRCFLGRDHPQVRQLREQITNATDKDFHFDLSQVQNRFEVLMLDRSSLLQTKGLTHPDVVQNALRLSLMSRILAGDPPALRETLPVQEMKPAQQSDDQPKRDSASKSTNQSQTSESKLIKFPEWPKQLEFRVSKFTFARIKYQSNVPNRRSLWATDFPDADLNFSAQIGSMTKLDVSEPSRVLELTDPDLSRYPFTYLAEPGSAMMSEPEVVALRKYLLGGGFLMVDDFWGDAEWEHLRLLMKRVFPSHEPIELPLSHPVFNCVFGLTEKPQVTSISVFMAGRKSERLETDTASYKGIEDDTGRLMVIMCHNTDLGDGWERVDEDEKYRDEMSIKRAFPMGINIVYYVLKQSNSKEESQK